MQPQERRRFRLTLKTLMLVIGAIALLLAPVAWVLRNQALLRTARLEALVAEERARAAAVREYARMRELEAAKWKESGQDVAKETAARKAAQQEMSRELELLREENQRLRETIKRLERRVPAD